MKNIAFAVLTLLLFTTAAACEMLGPSSTPSGDEQRTDSTLVGPEWQLVSLNGTVVDPEYERPQVDTSQAYYSVVFTDTAKAQCALAPSTRPADQSCVYVRGYPNVAHGRHEVEPNLKMSINIQVASEIAPLPGSKEDEFFAALKAATTYEIDGNRLRIHYDDGEALVFEKASDESQP